MLTYTEVFLNASLHDPKFAPLDKRNRLSHPVDVHKLDCSGHVNGLFKTHWSQLYREEISVCVCVCVYIYTVGEI